MQPASRIVIGTLIFFLIITVGFASGFYVHSQKNKPDAESALSAFTEAPVKPNHKTYTISPPSIGIFYKTFSLDVPPGTYLPVITLPADKTAEIKTGQKILFYSKRDEKLDLSGEVIAIQQVPEENSVKLMLGIKGEDPAILEKVARGEITLEKSYNVSRLPKSAIVQNKDGQTFAWEVNAKQDDTKAAYLKSISVLGTTSDMVAVNPFTGTSNVFILDPDKNLRDGHVINIKTALYDGPEYPESEILAQDMENRIAKMQKALALQKPSAPATGGSASCATTNAPATCASSSAAQDFIAKIRSMAVPSGAAPAQ